MTAGWVRCELTNFTLETEWEAGPGEVLVLYGPSGAGKTTTLRAIAGLVRPREGHIEVGGRAVYDGEAKVWVAPHQRNVGYLTQQYNLFPHLTVGGNIRYGLSRQAAPEQRARVESLVGALQLEGMEGRRTWELSGGQQQRVALARALATNPAALLLDEPFSSLDAELRRAIRGEIRAILAQTNIPVILVTHDREEALALGDTVQVIDEGKTLDRGDPLRMLGQPGQGRVARLVGVENVLPMRVEDRYPQDGTMVCAMRDEPPLRQPRLRLEVPLSDFEIGGRLRVGIRASDVILAGEQLVSSSARNQLAGRVTGVEMRPPGYEVTLECSGVPFRCHITGRSLTEMDIRPGLELWAVFKASSCFMVGEEPAAGAKGRDGPGTGDQI